MGAILHPSCSGLRTVLALEAGAIPQIERVPLTDAIDYLENSAINYRGHAHYSRRLTTLQPQNAAGLHWKNTND